MADKITTLKEEITGNDIYPNVKEENIPDSIQRKLTSGDGINIDNNQVSLGIIQDKNIPDSTNKEVAFNNGVKTNKVTNINGYDVIKDDGSHVTIGNSSRITQINGSASRLTYNGQDLALLTDSDSSLKTLLWANLGIGRWSHQKFISIYWAPTPEKYVNNFYDDLADNYSVTNRMFAYSSWVSNYPMYLKNNYTNNGQGITTAKHMFDNFTGVDVLYLSNMIVRDVESMFNDSKFTKILVQDGCEVFLGYNYSANSLFRHMSKLIEVGTIDFSKTLSFSYLFEGCTSLKTIHCKHFKHSFDISVSTAFEESDLVEILNNLDVVSTTQTLTMGATNLAKLTTDDILIATGKGWQLA